MKPTDLINHLPHILGYYNLDLPQSQKGKFYQTVGRQILIDKVVNKPDPLVETMRLVNEYMEEHGIVLEAEMGYVEWIRAGKPEVVPGSAKPAVPDEPTAPEDVDEPAEPESPVEQPTPEEPTVEDALPWDELKEVKQLNVFTGNLIEALRDFRKQLQAFENKLTKDAE